VPAAAVSRFAGVQKVWLVVDGKARQQTVRTGRETEGKLEILDGLAAGDVIVSDAATGHDGPVIAVAAEAASGQLSAISDQPEQQADTVPITRNDSKASTVASPPSG
jgi:hypothetical protein